MSALDMDAEIRARWVAELRSGKRQQAREALRDDSGGLCCLGVLCELAVEDGLIGPASLSLDGSWQYGTETQVLPAEVAQWAGLGGCNPAVPDAVRDADTPLSWLNDGYEADESDPDDEGRDPWSFAQIADAIEGRSS